MSETPQQCSHHKEGVLCIISVAGSDTIKWFWSFSPDAMCTATASSEGARPTAIWQRLCYSLVLCFVFLVSSGIGRGYKTTPKWGIKPPPTPFLAIFDPWGGFMPPWGGFIPPFAGVGLSPHRGGFIPLFGHWGGFITPLGWFYPPFLVILSPYWPGGGGLADLNVNQETQSRKTDRRTVHSSACFGLDCFALLCCVVPYPPPPRA